MKSHGESLTELFKLRDTTGADPFRNKNAAVMPKAGIVRMHELPFDPLRAVTADRSSVLGCDPSNIVTQASHDFVLFVQQSDARMQFWNHQQVFPCLDIGG